MVGVFSLCIQHLAGSISKVTSGIAYGECYKNEPVFGMSCVRDLYFCACSFKMYCRGSMYMTRDSLGLHDTAIVQQEHKY